MSDGQIIEYLRERGRTEVPMGFVSSVMSAVDEAPLARSWFGISLPGLGGVAVAAAAIAVALALILGAGRLVGPAPTRTPSATTSAGTVGGLKAELAAAVDALRAAPGVRGQHTAGIGEVLGSAVWFDWRSNGDYVVVQRTDIDATQTFWWVDPVRPPLVVGERVSTAIWVIAGDRLLFSGFMSAGTTGGWQDLPRDSGPSVVTYATGLLAGENDPANPTEPLTALVLGTPDITTGSIERRLDGDGRVTWTARTPWRGGTAIQRWEIAPDGTLRSWTWDLVGASLDREGGFDGNMTSASLDFEVLADPAPIFVPDLLEPPDPAAFGLPADFPMAAP